MPTFVEKYTHEQREAVAQAFIDRGIRPATRVVDQAKAGELTYNGRKLEPFDIPEATVRDCARKLRQRRAGEVKSKLIGEPDAVQQLKNRLLAMVEAEITAEQRKKDGKRDGEHLRQLARALREAAAIPDRTAPKPKAPGSNAGGEREGGDTSGGLAGDIMRAAGLGGRKRG